MHPQPQDLLGNNHVAGPVQSFGSLFSSLLTPYFLAAMENWFTGTQIKLFLCVAVNFMRWLFGGGGGGCVFVHSSGGPHSSGP